MKRDVSRSRRKGRCAVWNSRSFAIAACVLTALSARAVEIDTEWIAEGNGNWMDAPNWSAGVPNNVGEDSFNARIDAWSSDVLRTVTLEGAEVTIGNLAFERGRLIVTDAALTVTGGTTLGGDVPWSPGRLILSVTDSQVDLGSVAAFATDVFDQFKLEVAGGAGDYVQWKDAAIHTIGADGSLTVTGGAGRLRDSVSGDSALAGLQEVRGELKLQEGDYDFAGSLATTKNSTVELKNATVNVDGRFEQGGNLRIREEGSITVAENFVHSGKSSFGVAFEDEITFSLTVGGDFEQTGDMQFHGSGSIDVTGHLVNSGMMNFGTYSESEVALKIGGDLRQEGELTVNAKGSVEIGGDLVNTSYVTFANFYAGSLTAMVAGDLDNTGRLTVFSSEDSGKETVTTVSIQGGLGQLQNGVLTAGDYSVYANGNATAILEWKGADIEVISTGVAVFVGRGGGIRDRETGENALRNLREVNGLLGVADHTVFNALKIGETGDVTLNSGEVNGDLEQAGRFEVDGELEVTGRFVNTGFALVDAPGGGTYAVTFGGDVEQGNRLSFRGSGSIEVGGDFLNSGETSIITRFSGGVSLVEMTVGGNFEQSGTFEVEGQGEIDVAGDFVNTGETRFYNGRGQGSPAGVESLAITVGGVLDNTGDLLISTYGRSPDPSEVSFTVEGGLAQLQDGVLTAGTYRVVAQRDSFALFRWTGADIHVIGEEASIVLDGASASMSDRVTGDNALRNLREVNGSLRLIGQQTDLSGDLKIGASGSFYSDNGSVAVAGNLEQAGKLELDGENALDVKGDFTNTGTTGVGLYWGSDVLVTVDGRFEQAGEFTMDGAGALTVEGDIVNTGSLKVGDKGWDKIDVTTWSNFTQSGSFVMNGETTLHVSGNFVNEGETILRDGEAGSFSAWIGGDLTQRATLDLVGNGSLEVMGGFANTGTTRIIGLDRDLTVTVSGVLDNERSVSVEDGALFTVRNELVQLQDGVLTAGSYRVSSSSGSSTVLEWNGADIEVIGENAAVILDGAGSVLRDRLTHENALRNLREVQGELRLTNQDLAFSGNLAVGDIGSINLQAANVTVAGDFTNEGWLEAWEGSKLVVTGRMGNLTPEGELTGGTYWLTGELSATDFDIRRIGENAAINLFLDGKLTNSTTGESALANLEAIDGQLAVTSSFTTKGDLSVSGNLQLQGPGFGDPLRFEINGALAQQVGTTLTGGTIDIVSSDPNPVVLAWKGAHIETIGAGASLTLAGKAISIQDSNNGSNALRGLSRNEGRLRLLGHHLELKGGLVNTGSLEMEEAELVLGGKGVLRNEGVLDIRSWVEVTGAVELAADGVTTIHGGLLGMNLYGFGTLVAETITLDGEIRLVVSPNWMPLPDVIYEILDGESLVGTFAGLPDGARVLAWKGDSEVVGSFTITYDYANGDVLLSNFAAIPEPATVLLLGFGLTATAWSMKRRR